MCGNGSWMCSQPHSVKGHTSLKIAARKFQEIWLRNARAR